MKRLLKGMYLLQLTTLILLLVFTSPAYTTAEHSENHVPVSLESASACSLTTPQNVSSPMTITCSIFPSDNAYVDNLFPTKAFGGAEVLIVQNTPSIPVSRNDAFLKFDLRDNLPQDLAQSMAKPANASLLLFVRLMNFYYNATVEIHTATPNNWTENAITWNNMPNIDQANASVNIQENGTWAQWNISRMIQPVFNATGQVTLAATSPQTAWRNLIWFDSREYPSFNETTAPRLHLTFIEPSLTIQTPFPNIDVSVGSRELTTDGSGTVHTMLPWGVYQIAVPDIIPMANGTRAAFQGWNDLVNVSNRPVTLGNNLTLSARYGLQHLLRASSTYGTMAGGGWYFENTLANVTLEQSSIPIEGISGWLGGRYVFDHWSGDCRSSTTQCSILMDGPKTVSANWRTDWTETIIASIVLAASCTVASLLRMRRKKSSMPTRRTKSARHRQRTRQARNLRVHSRTRIEYYLGLRSS